MLDLILKDTFSRRFLIKASRQNTAGGLLQPLKFTDKNRAFSLVCGLCVPHGYWSQTLHSIERGNLSSIHTKSTSGRDSAEHRIAQYLYHKRIYIYELVNYNLNKDNLSNRSFEQSNGDSYTFSHVSAQLLASTQQPIELQSESAIGRLLWSLSCNEKQLNELAQALDLGGAENTGGAQTGGAESRERIIAAILAGEVIVSLQPKVSTPPKPLELLLPTVADRSMQGPPSSPADSVTEPASVTGSVAAGAATAAAIAAVPASIPDPRTQGEILEKAAEDGAPSCEECEKARAARVKSASAKAANA